MLINLFLLLCFYWFLNLWKVTDCVTGLTRAGLTDCGWKIKEVSLIASCQTFHSKSGLALIEHYSRPKLIFLVLLDLQRLWNVFPAELRFLSNQYLISSYLFICIFGDYRCLINNFNNWYSSRKGLICLVYEKCMNWDIDLVLFCVPRQVRACG